MGTRKVEESEQRERLLRKTLSVVTDFEERMGPGARNLSKTCKMEKVRKWTLPRASREGM